MPELIALYIRDTVRALVLGAVGLTVVAYCVVLS